MTALTSSAIVVGLCHFVQGTTFLQTVLRGASTFLLTYVAAFILASVIFRIADAEFIEAAQAKEAAQKAAEEANAETEQAVGESE